MLHFVNPGHVTLTTGLVDVVQTSVAGSEHLWQADCQTRAMHTTTSYTHTHTVDIHLCSLLLANDTTLQTQIGLISRSLIATTLYERWANVHTLWHSRMKINMYTPFNMPVLTQQMPKSRIRLPPPSRPTLHALVHWFNSPYASSQICASFFLRRSWQIFEGGMPFESGLVTSLTSRVAEMLLAPM